MAKRKTNEQLLAEWKRRRGGFGRLRKLPSGRLQASFKGPDGALYKAPQTFEFDFDTARAGGDGAHLAEAWLYEQKQLIRHAEATGEQWQSPQERKTISEMTVKALIEDWLANSEAITKESTRQKHRQYLDLRVLCDSRPGFDSLKDVLVVDVDRNLIRLWWRQINGLWGSTGSTNSYAYKRLHTAFNYAVNTLEIIPVNPVKIPGAGVAPRSKKKDIPVISPSEATALTASIVPRLKAPVGILLYAGLRLGELLELRRKDLDVHNDTVTIKVRRNAQPIKNPVTKKIEMTTLDTPKTKSGIRDVVLPDFAAAWVVEHLNTYVGKDDDDFLVTTNTGNRFYPSFFRKLFSEAATAAGRSDISPHDCRRFFGTNLVRAGVPLDEGRRIMGHSTIQQMMEYQRAAANYQASAASALNALFTEHT